MTPAVSVLFPIYNTASYLREAVDSILGQTFADFELITLDDCSPDNAEEILDSYCDPRIVRYRGEKNVGLANILNVGISMAHGQYIARMDSDDISLPDRLQIEVEYLENHPEVDLVSCGMREFGCGSRVYSYSGNLDYVKFTSLFYTPVLHASSVWRKESFERNALHFEQDFVPAEDYDLWVRALEKGLVLINIPQVEYLYRIFEGQATGNTEKVAAAVDAVKTRYFESVFPGIDSNTVRLFLSMQSDAVSSPYSLSRTLVLLREENKKNHYIDSKKLMHFTQDYFRRSLYSFCLRHGYTLKDLMCVGVRRSLKLIINDFFHNNTCL